MLEIIQLIVGAIQLFLGRKIFWLMVGIMGFLLGLTLTMLLFDWALWVKLLVGLGIGAIFSVLAVVIQKPMAAIFGFFAFGLAAAALSRLWSGGGQNTLFWIVFLVGGIVGVILVFALYEWALIIGSSLSGAGAMVIALGSILHLQKSGLLSIIIFLVLLLVGIVFQAKSLKPTAR